MGTNLEAVLPPPAVYEQEYRYWPWGNLIRRAHEFVITNAPSGSNIFDYMCGTGYLISMIRERRPDVVAEGCDVYLPYVEFGREHHGQITLYHGDALVFSPVKRSDVILCTAGLHHLSFDDQVACLAKFANDCHSETLLLFGEEVTPSYINETERRLATLRLNSDLISLGIENGWPASLIEAALDVAKNDVMGRGEFKRDQKNWERIIGAHFQIVETITTWESSAGGADILFICKPMKR